MKHILILLLTIAIVGCSNPKEKKDATSSEKKSSTNTAVSAQENSDPFYLPQSNQPFEGKVDTRIGKLEFENQYPIFLLLKL